MTWRPISTIVFVSMVLAPATHAGWYASVFAGLNEVDDTTLETSLGTLERTYDGGLAWGFAVGYEFSRFRLEGEILSERANDVSVHRLDGLELAGSFGALENEVGIANIVFDLRPEARVSPYVGVGVGVAEVTLKDYGSDGIPEAFAEDNVLAYQAILGIGIEVTPKWTLQFDGRFLATDEAELDLLGVSNDLSYEAVNVTAGLRYSF